jgi:alpha-L-fucosidase
VKGAIRLNETTVVSARCFRGEKPVSGAVSAKFSKVAPRPAMPIEGLSSGISYAYFEGDWVSLPDFGKLTAVKENNLANFDFSPRNQVEHFGFQYIGFIRILAGGVYAFFTDSDDGSRLYIGETMVVDNDGLHGMKEKRGVIALAAGLHPIRVDFFEKTGGDDLKIYIEGPKIEKQLIPDAMLFRGK